MSFENFEQPKKIIKPEAPKDPSRRKFFKDGSLAVAGFFLGAHKFKNNLENKNIEQNEELCFVKREDWDERWEEIKVQYEKEYGEKFNFEIKGKKYERFVSSLSYLDKGNIENKELKDSLIRMVVHHSAMESKKSPVDQVKYIRDYQMGKRKFDDIAYHFLIGEDGTIFEGLPIDRVGLHAGATLESSQYFKEHLPNKIKDLHNEKDPEEYKKKLEHFKNATKKDPDYGSIGICLLGNFNTNKEVSEMQEKALVGLLELLKNQYEIPKDNIIYHSEVKEKVVEASGGKLVSHKTNCPGDKFLEKDKILEKLTPDSEEAKCKSILLEK